MTKVLYKILSILIFPKNAEIRHVRTCFVSEIQGAEVKTEIIKDDKYP